MATPTLLRSYKAEPAAGTANVTIASVDTTGASVLVIKVGEGYEEGAVNTPTFDGSSTGMVKHVNYQPAILPRNHVWYLNAPTETTADVVVSTTAYSTRCVIVEVWSNTHATAPLGTVVSASASGGTNPAVTVTTGTADDIICDIVATRAAVNPTTLVITGPASGQTLIQNAYNGETSGTTNSSTASAYAAGGTSVLMDYTLSATDRWAISGYPMVASEDASGISGQSMTLRILES